VRLEVIGLAAPQGSKTRMPNGAMVDGTSTTGRAKLVEWRRAVADAGRAELARNPQPPYQGPTAIVISFRFPTVASDPHRYWHATNPDASKILRSTEDALVHAGVLADDRILSKISITKRYVNDNELPGCTVEITSLESEEAEMKESRKQRAQRARRQAAADQSQATLV
jgi:Holliday junction resolvase RusA-like endonuclease